MVKAFLKVLSADESGTTAVSLSNELPQVLGVFNRLVSFAYETPPLISQLYEHAFTSGKKKLSQSITNAEFAVYILYNTCNII